jgi:spore coat protein CotH
VSVKKFEENTLMRFKVQEMRKKQSLRELKKNIEEEELKEINKTKLKYSGPKVYQLPL